MAALLLTLIGKLSNKSSEDHLLMYSKSNNIKLNSKMINVIDTLDKAEKNSLGPKPFSQKEK